MTLVPCQSHLAALRGSWKKYIGLHYRRLDRALVWSLVLADAFRPHQRLFDVGWSLQFGPSLFGINERVVSLS